MGPGFISTLLPLFPSELTRRNGLRFTPKPFSVLSRFHLDHIPGVAD